MTRRIFFRPERCMACLSCVLACQMASLGISDVREIPRDRKPVQRIFPGFDGGTPWLWRCQHCASAPCIDACVSGSLRREEGRPGVVHHPETCVGCGSCLLVCPYHALVYDEAEERVAKCNLCADKEMPSCVGACRTGALIYSPPRLVAWEKRKRFAQEFRKPHERE